MVLHPEIDVLYVQAYFLPLLEVRLSLFLRVFVFGMRTHDEVGRSRNVLIYQNRSYLIK